MTRMTPWNSSGRSRVEKLWLNRWSLVYDEATSTLREMLVDVQSRLDSYRVGKPMIINMLFKCLLLQYSLWYVGRAVAQ